MNKPNDQPSDHYKASAAPTQRLTPEQITEVQAALGHLEASEDADWGDLHFLRFVGGGALFYKEQRGLLNGLLAKWGGAK